MNKYFVIPVLVMALVTAVSAPPAQAELVTITVVLVAAFGAAVATSEITKYRDDKEETSNKSELAKEDNPRYAFLEM